MSLRSILRRINIIMMMVVVVHMLSQLLNATLAMNLIVGTDNVGLLTRRDVYIFYCKHNMCAKDCRIRRSGLGLFGILAL
jgi:hypothetical protein